MSNLIQRHFTCKLEFYINFENGKFVRPSRSNEQFLFFSVFVDASFARYNVQGREATKGTCTKCLVMSVSHSVKDQRVSLWINQSIDVIITCKPISQSIRFYVSQSVIRSACQSMNQTINWSIDLSNQQPFYVAYSWLVYAYWKSD